MGGSHPSQGPVSFSLSLCLFKGKESHLLLRGSVCQLWIIIQILKAAHEGQPAVTRGPESLKTNLGVGRVGVEMGVLGEGVEEFEESGAGFGLDEDLPGVAAGGAFVEGGHGEGNVEGFLGIGGGFLR